MFFILSFCFDLFIGDPRTKVHPVVIIGHFSNFLSRYFLIFAKNRKNALLFLGLLLLVCTIIVSLGLVSILFFVVKQVVNTVDLYILSLKSPESILKIFLAFFASLSFSYRSLVEHALSVKKSLEKGTLQEARDCVSRMVGRDTENLNREEVRRAAIESTAESFVDGFVSPLFYAFMGIVYAILFSTGNMLYDDKNVSVYFFAVLGMYFYRSVNTLDSMVAYKNKKYLYFGRASAYMDDLLNYIPARLSVFFVFLSSAILRLDTKALVATVLKDTSNYESPNAAYPQAAFAGAMNISLGGTNYYEKRISKKGKLGLRSKREELADKHIQLGTKIYLCCCFFCILFFSLLFYLLVFLY